MGIAWQDLLDFFFPPKMICSWCGERLKQTVFPFCKTCLAKIEFLSLTPNWEIAAMGLYSGLLRDAIHRLKYQGQERLAEPLGKILTQYIASNLGQVAGLVPIPLHHNRLRKRGFNQSLLLSQVVGADLGVPVFSQVLIRTRDTVSQVGLSREQRLENMTNAFQVINLPIITDKHLLLVDDVYTTGITTLEAKNALLKAGAKEVRILVLARGRN